MRPIYRLVSLAFVSCLLAASCATVVPYSPKAPTVIGDAKAIMTDHPCGPLAIDQNGGVNNAPGWVLDKAPAGMDSALTCGAKYNQPAYCLNGACQTLVYKSVPKALQGSDRGRDWTFVADVLDGSALACADQCNKWTISVSGNRGQLDCAWQPIEGTVAAPRRYTFTAKVPSDEGTSPAMCLYIRPNPAKLRSIALGQIGTAQSPTP